MLTCEGDSSDESAEEERGLDHGGGRVRGEGGVVVDVGREACQHCSHAHLNIPISEVRNLKKKNRKGI